MIPWLSLATNALWIFGLAVELAVLSYAYWRGQVEGGGMRGAFGRRNVRLGLNGGGLLFCLGLAATAGEWFEIVLWIALAASFGFQIVRRWLL